jgi:putative heme iron utilization protein
VTPTLRELLAAERHGVLATLAARRHGWPYASVTAYTLSERGEPVFLLSDLAEHTRNIQVDRRASLLVQDAASLTDPLAGARVTLLGEMETVPAAERSEAQAIYLARHPMASEYLTMSDFHLFVMRVSEARFIAGFGDMGWVGGDKLRGLLVD